MQIAPITPAPLHADTLAALVLGGDLSRLSSQQKVEYYNHLCNRVGLDPATQPFRLMRLQGKETLYCDRGGAAQLAKKHELSTPITNRQMMNDVCVVTAKAITPGGRYTESIGAVPVGGLKGEAYANAIMKAETKAKRRATLDLLGLGMMDESELSSVSGAVPLPSWSATPALVTVDVQQPKQEAPAPEVSFSGLFGPEEVPMIVDYLRHIKWIREDQGLDRLHPGQEARIRQGFDAFLNSARSHQAAKLPGGQ